MRQRQTQWGPLARRSRRRRRRKRRQPRKRKRLKKQLQRNRQRRKPARKRSKQPHLKSNSFWKEHAASLRDCRKSGLCKTCPSIRDRGQVLFFCQKDLAPPV